MEASTFTETVNAWYERVMFGGGRSLFDKIGFCNMGFWDGVDNNVEFAQLNMIETLVKFFTERDGYILDVACGKGVSSKFLTKYFDPTKIVGINISERQLECCRIIAPECTFRLMDAVELDFSDSSFDNVLCIQSALHFSTRQRFFEEAYRVLRPGGRIAISDLLFDYDQLDEDMRPTVPRENHLPHIDGYREALAKAGFRYVRVDDCTEVTVFPAIRYQIRMEEIEFAKRQDPKHLETIRHAERAREVFTCCMAYAIR